MKGQIYAEPAGFLTIALTGYPVSKQLMQVKSGYTIPQITDKTFHLNPNCDIFIGVSDPVFVIKQVVSCRQSTKEN